MTGQEDNTQQQGQQSQQQTQTVQTDLERPRVDTGKFIEKSESGGNNSNKKIEK